MTMTDAADTSKPVLDADKSRLLHTMIRVRDLDASLNFYTNQLGMKLLRKRDYPSGKFTLAFVGYGDETNSTVLELTHNWEQAESYNLGSAFGHLAIAVPDVYKACESLAAAGVKIPRPAGPMAHGGSVIAFIEDPDGYRIELIERS
jgi:lactoylglutathione lyase